MCLSFMWTLINFYFEASILMWTPKMLATSSNDKIFAMGDSFMWTCMGQNINSPIWSKHRWPPLVSIRNFSSALHLRTFLAKYEFLGRWPKNRYPGESNCRWSARSVGYAITWNYEWLEEIMCQCSLPRNSYRQYYPDCASCNMLHLM